MHTRASYRFEAFSDEFSIPEDVATIITEALESIHRVLPAETDAAQLVFDQKVLRKQNHQKDATVQAKVLDFASYLAGTRCHEARPARWQNNFKT